MEPPAAGLADKCFGEIGVGDLSVDFGLRGDKGAEEEGGAVRFLDGVEGRWGVA